MLSSTIGRHSALVCLSEISCGGFSLSRTQIKSLKSHVLPWVLLSVSFLKENRINIAFRQRLTTFTAQTPTPSHSLPHTHLLNYTNANPHACTHKVHIHTNTSLSFCLVFLLTSVNYQSKIPRIGAFFFLKTPTIFTLRVMSEKGYSVIFGNEENKWKKRHIAEVDE